MNQLSSQRRAQIVAALVEGCSIRATSRLTGAAKNTITKLLLELGAACSKYQRETLVGLKSRRIQCDEIWAFCHSKQKNVAPEHEGILGYGDVWTWVGIDADSKLVLSWLCGGRDAEYAKVFMEDLAGRLTHQVQLTTDGHKAYLDAVAESFGCYVDYAMLIKLFGEAPKEEKRYSPAACKGIKKVRVAGHPDPAHVSTSFVERQNLTMRMAMRRFTRLTNAFSKKLENMEAAVALHFMYYNFVRVHQTLRVTPAMEAGVATHPWEISDIIDLLDMAEA